MSDSSDTSTIDDKKSSRLNISVGITGNISKFLKSIFIFIILIIIYLVSGSLVLYGCKLGQSNILPTDSNCYPFTNFKPTIEEIQTNIFTTFTDPQLSMKMKFPYDKYNSSNKILDMFREYKEEGKSHYLINYFISIMESLILVNYSSINFILNTLNGLPEILIILFGPIMAIMATTFLFLFDHLYIIYLWFANMGWFLKHNINKDINHKPIWHNVTLMQPVKFGIAITLIILFAVLCFILFPFLSVLSFLSLFWCFFSCISYKAVMNDKYIDASNNLIESCWKIDGNGISRIKNENEWYNRLLSLKQQITYWINNPSGKMIEILQLYYDQN